MSEEKDKSAAGATPDRSDITLSLRNGQAAPFAGVPCVSFSMFAHAVQTFVREGGRLSALFALPPEDWQASGPGGASEGEFRLLAVISSDRDGLVHLTSTVVEGSYPSLTPKVPQAHLFERELHEKYGLLPEGHPWLKPVRFSRTEGPPVGMADFYTVAGDEVHEVAVGPVHAGIIECGHFRFQCLGEVVMHLEISLGYHHRGLEALLLDARPERALRLMECASGDASVAHAWAFATLLEALSECVPSPRGQLVRALGLELERLANHTGDMGALAGDVGFLPTQAYCGRLRGDWLNMSALLCGSRFGRGLVRPGGSAFDVDAAVLAALKERLRATARDVRGALRVLWNSPSVAARFSGIGLVAAKDAVELGLVGVAARACGLERDVRSTHPLDGLPVPPKLRTRPQCDVYARAKVRHEEIRESVVFCRRLLDEFLDAGGRNVPAPDRACQPLLPDAIAVSLVEGWRGEICQTALTDAGGRLRAVSIVDPSFHNWMGLAMALRNGQISDFPLCNKSFNLSYCGHDL